MVQITSIQTQEQFESGLTYLNRFFPHNIHALSCYKGNTFKNTYRMLSYDIEKRLIDNDIELKGIQRYIAYSSNGEVEGVAIKFCIPEFYQYLEYETYAIVLANNYQSFYLLFQEGKTNEKTELITFRENERKYVIKDESIREIHFWNTYLIRGKNCSIEMRKPCNQDFERLVSDYRGSIADICRCWEFEKNGIEDYYVFVMQDGKEYPVAFCALLPYFNDIMEIKICYCMEIFTLGIDRLVLYLRKVIFSALGTHGKAIIRVKNIDTTLQKLFTEKKIACISKEQHLHLNT